MTNEQKLHQNLKRFLQIGKKEAQEKISKALNIDAVAKLKEAVSKAKKHTIEDVTPEGYGN